MNNSILSNNSISCNYNNIKNSDPKKQSLLDNKAVARRNTVNNQISPISGTRDAKFNKINGFKECLAEIKYNCSDDLGNSMFEQILALCTPQAECIKNLALNKHGSWSLQAITLGVKKELSALFIAEKGRESFNMRAKSGSSDYTLNTTAFKEWFMSKFEKLQNKQSQVYHSDLISNIWQHVSHQNSCFGRFSGLTDVTLNRYTDIIAFGSGYDIQENLNDLYQLNTTKTALATTKAVFDDPDTYKLNTTNRLSIVPVGEGHEQNRINVVIRAKDEEYKQIKSKDDLNDLNLTYLDYCSAENATDVTLLDSLATQDFSDMDYAKTYSLCYILDEYRNPPTLTIKSISSYCENHLSENISKNNKLINLLDITVVKTINLLNQKVEDYTVSASSQDEGVGHKYHYWANKLKQEWSTRLNHHQDDTGLSHVYNSLTDNKKKYQDNIDKLTLNLAYQYKDNTNPWLNGIVSEPNNLVFPINIQSMPLEIDDGYNLTFKNESDIIPECSLDKASYQMNGNIILSSERNDSRKIVGKWEASYCLSINRIQEHKSMQIMNNYIFGKVSKSFVHNYCNNTETYDIPRLEVIVLDLDTDIQNGDLVRLIDNTGMIKYFCCKNISHIYTFEELFFDEELFLKKHTYVNELENLYKQIPENLQLPNIASDFKYDDNVKYDSLDTSLNTYIGKKLKEISNCNENNIHIYFKPMKIKPDNVTFKINVGNNQIVLQSRHLSANNR